MLDWNYRELQRKPRPLHITATPDQLAILLRRSLPYLEWIGNQSAWPQPHDLVQEIYRAIGIDRENAK